MIERISNSNLNFNGAHLCKKNYETREVFKRDFYYSDPRYACLKAKPFPRDEFMEALKDVDKTSDRKNYEIYVKLNKDRTGEGSLSDKLVLEATIHKNPPKNKKNNTSKVKDRVLIVKGSNLTGVFELFKTNTLYVMEGMDIQTTGKDDVTSYFRTKRKLNTQA
ncbi:MAG: hypothetical protein IJ877_00740 [Candidatus Gastranaerophilales bacterium]|nr:hypothetical protein [Candidatus Gastranaerophilales bacterium]